jgi:hypothetical protein
LKGSPRRSKRSSSLAPTSELWIIYGMPGSAASGVLFASRLGVLHDPVDEGDHDASGAAIGCGAWIRRARALRRALGDPRLEGLFSPFGT